MVPILDVLDIYFHWISSNIVINISICGRTRKKLENLRLKNCKKWHEWYSNPRSPATMPGTLTTGPLWHLVTAADQAYLIITNVLIYCTVAVTMSRDIGRKIVRSQRYFPSTPTENNINVGCRVGAIISVAALMKILLSVPDALIQILLSVH